MREEDIRHSALVHGFKIFKDGSLFNINEVIKKSRLNKSSFYSVFKDRDDYTFQLNQYIDSVYKAKIDEYKDKDGLVDREHLQSYLEEVARMSFYFYNLAKTVESPKKDLLQMTDAEAESLLTMIRDPKAKPDIAGFNKSLKFIEVIVLNPRYRDNEDYHKAIAYGVSKACSFIFKE